MNTCEQSTRTVHTMTDFAACVLSLCVALRYNSSRADAASASAAARSLALTTPALTAGTGTSFAVMSASSSCARSAAAMAVSSALVSYAGDTSTMSAPTMFRPTSERTMRLTSRVVQPPDSGVPAGISGWNGTLTPRRHGRVNRVNVERQVDGAVAEAFLERFRNAVGAELVNVVGGERLEADDLVVEEVVE